MMEEHRVPYRIHLAALTQIKQLFSQNKRLLERASAERTRHQRLMESHEQQMLVHARQMQEWDRTANHLLSIEKIEGKPGRPGRDAEAPSLGEIVSAVVSTPQFAALALPQTESRRDEKAEKDRWFEEFIERIRKERLIDVSHIKNFQSFVYGKKKYGVHELMRGAGGSGSSGSSTPLIPTGLVNAVNAVFGTTSEPTSVIADGITYFAGAGYSYDSGTGNITMDVSPSQYIRYYA